MKVTIIGAGNVGATTAQRVSSFELAHEVVLLDVVHGVAEGKAMDMYQAAPLIESDTRIIGTGNYEATANSDIVIITAGMRRKPGMTHDDLLVKNAEIVRGVTREVVRYSPDCLLIIVSTPLDEMTYVARETSGFGRKRVIGMSGILDTARLKSFIAQELNVGVEDIDAIVLGSRGKGMIPLLRYATVSGIPVSTLLPEDRLDALVHRTRYAGDEIIERLKTKTAFYAPSAAITAMVKSIVHNKHRIMPCSVVLQGEFGLKNLAIGVPIKLGRSGMEKIIEVKLMSDEKKALHDCAGRVRENLAKIF